METIINVLIRALHITIISSLVIYLIHLLINEIGDALTHLKEDEEQRQKQQ